MSIRFRRFAAAVPLLSLSTFCLDAQQDRITARIDNSRRAVLYGNIHPLAQPRFDQGTVAASAPVRGMMLTLKQSASQQTALNQLLEDQQNPSSPNYHKWLTPEQYADRFGLSQSDVDKVTAWLRSEGFTVNGTARARNWVRFSGTAGQVSTTFQTGLHRYVVNGESHVANATEPTIPAALRDTVLGVRGLNNFRPKPRIKRPRPEMTTATGTHHLVPDDLATIYNINALYNAHIDGSGQKIVVVGVTNIHLSDIRAFRAKFNLDADPTQPNLPQVVLDPNGKDPGFGTSDDLLEADLDTEWAGAIAKNASIIYVYSEDPFTAANYAIDQNLGQVISISYGFCELMDFTDLPLFQSWAQQANSQGITMLAASGDAGAGDCEDINGTIAQTGLAADIPGVIPEITSVGGTEFNEQGGSYWSGTNNANGGSALSYIPEIAWNDTGLGQGFSATGGGASVFFPKPAWQTGPGVPNDGHRDVPDISFPASPAHDTLYAYSGGAGQYLGGTSFAAPALAGVVGLLNHYLSSTGAQSGPGVGNINPMLYHLAQNTSGIFHDIQSGDNAIPCVAGSPNCSPNGSLGYSAVSGYDLATGLGSVDVTNLVHQWSSMPPVQSAVVASVDKNPVYQVAPDRSGFQWPFTLTLNEEAGIATTLTGFTMDGTDYSSQIASFFGSATIPAKGSISASLGFKTLRVPRTIALTFSGVDPGTNHTWSTQLSVPFQGTEVTQVIAGASNAASGQQVYAPGMIMSVYGVQMATAIQVASGAVSPLPNFMAGVSAYVNSVPAPLYYVSPTQLNIQIPYETQPGSATLEVDTPYETSQITIQVAATAPGIFTLPDGSVTPSNHGSRGSTYTLFITGDGQVTPTVATGSMPSPRRTPKPNAPVTLTIGGVDATAGITYLGIPSWSVGVTQINFTVPQNVPVGQQQVVVTVGGVASAPANFTVQ